jgi:hypothetical protein
MPAGVTYNPLATFTVSGSSTTQINFTSISGSYTDLVLVAEMAPMPSVTAICFRYNGDSASNYAYVQLSGNGSSGTATSDQNQTFGLVSGALSNTTNRSMFIMNIMNYSNTTTYKPTINRGSRAIDTSLAAVSLCASTWRSTSAITQVTVTPNFGGGIVIPAGSMFTLYGIAAA